MVSASRKGKVGEGLFRKHLTSICTLQTRQAYRFPDAHAGSLAPTLADFMLVDSGKLYLMEVKETAYDNRLPHGNFNVDQVGRMRLWKLAGANCKVFIYHSKLGLWRMLDIDYFIEREGGSWFFPNIVPQRLEDLL